MRSIFTKILLWAVGTTIISLIGFAMTTRLIWQGAPHPGDFIRSSQKLQVLEAREAFEQGGPDRLATFLRRLDLYFDAKHALVDETGRDVLTGVDRSELLDPPSAYPHPPRDHRGLITVTTPSSGRFRLLIILRPMSNPVGMLPYYLWIFLMIAALGYALAVYLGSPLRSLRRVVERFGQGDLQARVGSSRRDEIGDLARAFDLMAERTETLMTSQKRLLQDVSHELRSPLSRLKLTVRLARTNQDREASLDRIKKEVDRLSTLVDELLQVTSAEEDPQAREHLPIALDALLRSVVEDESIEAEARSCELRLLKIEGADVIGDRELLHRALENVLRNATRHSPQNSNVEIELTKVDGRAAIAVRDFGEGVPEQALESIFEPFYRVGRDRSRSGGGVGLGLSITRRAIILHGGEIAAKNARPGLQVTIRLPLVDSDLKLENIP